MHEPPLLSPRDATAALGDTWVGRRALREATARGLVETTSQNTVQITETGRTVARSLVRTHRLWESFLVNRLGLSPDHVHDRAMELEHFTDEKLREELAERQAYPELDPHGKPIPKDS